MIEGPSLKIITIPALLVIILDLRTTSPGVALEVQLSEFVAEADTDGAEGNTEIGALIKVFSLDFRRKVLVLVEGLYRANAQAETLAELFPQAKAIHPKTGVLPLQRLSGRTPEGKEVKLPIAGQVDVPARVAAPNDRISTQINGVDSRSCIIGEDVEAHPKSPDLFDIHGAENIES